MDWRWVDRGALLLLHEESLAEHGGLPGLRGEGLLDSARSRPLNLLAYGDPDIAELAACYGVGLAKNHPFADGNKRAAFLAAGLFLAVNGYRLSASPVEATLAILAVAEGTLDEPGLAAWIRRHMALRRPAP